MSTLSALMEDSIATQSKEPTNIAPTNINCKDFLAANPFAED